MKRILRLSVSLVLFFAAAALSAFGSSPTIAVVRPNAPINPLTARFIDSRLGAAQQAGAELIVLDATNTVGDSSSVGQIVDRMRSSPIPIVVLPMTGGESLDSAMGYLQRAGAHVQSKAVPPGLSAGGATVGTSGIEDFVAGLDGQRVTFHGRELTLHTKGVPIRVYEMNGVARLLAQLLDPNLAYVLLVVGIIGIAVEFSLPGVGVPGILGGLSLLVSLVSLGALSVNLGGLLVVLLALLLFILDIKAATHGMLTAGGIVALLVGSFLLFPAPHTLPGLSPIRISPFAIAIMTALLSAVVATAVIVGTRTRRRKIVVGRETLVGMSGTALTDVDPEGLVRVANEEWSATSVGDEIKAGDEIDVVDVRGVHLVIMRRL